MLCLTRDEIIAYVNENKLDFVTDSTNLKEIYTRNKVRLSLIPEIEKNFNSNFIETTVKNAENIRYDKELLEQLADSAYKICVTANRADIKRLMGEHISVRRRILYRMLTGVTGFADISSVYIEAVSYTHLDVYKRQLV